MAISREKKELLVQKYVDQLNGSEAIIFTDYTGLSVGEIQSLRSRIREAEGSFTVVKNTLVRRALEEVGLPLEEDLLSGPIGLGFCNQNVTGVAKAISDFSKDNELLAIRGGLLGEKVIDEAAIKELASLPSLDVLRAQLLGVINAPASQLVGVVAGGVRQLVNVFNAYSETAAEGDAPAEA
jgi:large subunit ribosomal protein L10